MKGFILALQFFTRIPIPIHIEFSTMNLKRAFFFLPLVGGLIALITAIPMYAIPNKYSDFAAAASLVLYVILTGGLHIDGLADTADGFFSARSEKEKILEIMKDPGIGSYGAITVFILLLLKFIAFKTISAYGVIPPFLILIPAGIISRLSGLGVVVFAKQAKQTGLGILFHNSATRFSFFFWLILIFIWYLLFNETSLISILKINFSLQDILLKIKILFLPVLAFLSALCIVNVSYKKIGGTTGDVNGCIVEVTETVILITSIFIFN